MNAKPILILAIGGILLTIGDMIFKVWTQSQQAYLFAAGFSLYVLGLIFLVESYKYTNIAIASAIFIIFNLLSLSIMTWWYFNEPLSKFQIVAMIFTVMAVILFEL